MNIMFLSMFIILTTLGIYLRRKNKESRLVLWATLISICGGFTGLQIILEKEVLPIIIIHGSHQMVHVGTIIVGILNLIINIFPYYGILIFFLFYNGYFLYSKWIMVVLSFPIWISLFFFSDLSSNELDEVSIASWGAIYLIITGCLALRPIILSNDRSERMYHSSVSLIFLVPLICLNVFHFTPDPYSDQVLKMIPFICIGSFLFVFLLFLRGTFIGVKRKSIQTVNIGTAVIHHSLKNSIAKIKLVALNIRKSIELQHYLEVEEEIGQLLKTYDEMMGTMTKISHAVSDKLKINPQEHDLSDILDEVVEVIESVPNMKVEKHYFPYQVFVDRQCFIECLVNICNNAVEAMEDGGVIRIELELRRRVFILAISDTGKGMNPLQLQNMFEPFYSTKHQMGTNFGLGMYHVKKVIEAHKGKVFVKSKLGEGTTIQIMLKRWDLEK